MTLPGSALAADGSVPRRGAEVLAPCIVRVLSAYHLSPPTPKGWSEGRKSPRRGLSIFSPGVQPRAMGLGRGRVRALAGRRCSRPVPRESFVCVAERCHPDFAQTTPTSTQDPATPRPRTGPHPGRTPTSSPRAWKEFLVMGRRGSPAHHAHKTLSWHGARTSAPRGGTDPSAAQVRPSFVRQSAGRG